MDWRWLQVIFFKGMRGEGGGHQRRSCPYSHLKKMNGLSTKGCEISKTRNRADLSFYLMNVACKSDVARTIMREMCKST